MDHIQFTNISSLKSINLERISQLTESEESINPIRISKRSIATSLWGKMWCKNIERYEVFAPSLARGRSLARNNSLIDLKIKNQTIHAKIGDENIEQTDVKIRKIDDDQIKIFKNRVILKLNNLMELLEGSFSQELLNDIFNEDFGLFPNPGQIKMNCTCTEYHMMCSHAASALYGVGVVFDQNPKIFFQMIGMDLEDLFEPTFDNIPMNETNNDYISDLFNIELDEDFK